MTDVWICKDFQYLQKYLQKFTIFMDIAPICYFENFNLCAFNFYQLEKVKY